MMNQLEQRIALAEWMDLATFKISLAEKRLSIYTNGYLRGDCRLDQAQDVLTAMGIPDYPNDLNACHEVEKKLSEKQACKYDLILRDIAASNSGLNLCPSHGYKYFITSTEKSEALCRTLFSERFE